MDMRLEKRAGFRVAGVQADVTTSFNFLTLWDQLFQKVSEDDINAYGSGQIFGVGYDYMVKRYDSFVYMAGFDIQNAEEARKLGLDVLDIPSAEYAVFSLRGPVPQCISEAWQYIMEDFFPNGEYQRDQSPDFEMYGEGDMMSEDYKMELWIPVVKK